MMQPVTALIIAAQHSARTCPLLFNDGMIFCMYKVAELLNCCVHHLKRNDQTYTK